MISSPIHMITAVPDTIVTTMVRMVSGVGCGMSGWDAGPQLLPGNAAQTDGFYYACLTVT